MLLKDAKDISSVFHSDTLDSLCGALSAKAFEREFYYQLRLAR